MIQGIKLEFYLICRGKGIRVGVHDKISSTRLLLTPKSIFSETKKDSTTKVKKKVLFQIQEICYRLWKR
jgi:hypothetical protein